MADLFFTSDWHLGHNNVIEYCARPYESIEEMHDSLIENYNALVGRKDTCWFLGDISLYTNEEHVRILKALNGHKHMVWGNHDKRNKQLLAPLFESSQDYKELKHDKQKLILMHYPLLSWNGSKHGSIHLHGHCHGHLAFDPKYKRLDVGVDPWHFRPVLYEEIKAIMAGAGASYHHPKPKEEKTNGQDQGDQTTNS